MDKRLIFKTSLTEDIDGLMELYEASHLSMDGEDVLDVAKLFSAQLLTKSMTCLGHNWARDIANTLENPCHKSLTKFTARNLFGSSTCQSANRWINILHELAKDVFNQVQSLHKREILQVSQWWKRLGLAKELTFARDQPLKWYIWSMACLTDPSLSQHRVELTKPISFIYIIDDIFDVHGTLDELTLFTEAVNRWDSAVVEKLPHYMKICFNALDNLTNEISHKVYQEHGWDPLRSLRKTDISYMEQYVHKIEEFKNILISINISSNHGQRSLAALNMIDAVLRLGIEHHFQEEIEAILQRECLIFNADHDGEEQLYEVALCFRLLRQGGYHVSANVFNKFKDAEGKFNPTILAEDKEGLMQLFEASQLSVEEEHILEEAEDFSRYHLGSWFNRLEPSQARTMILYTLETPYHKSLARLKARNVLQSLQGAEEHWMSVLEEVAKIDFRIVQSMHQKEIVKITRWWEEIGLAKELKFARNQPLKWYLWTVATLADPSLSDQRIELTKPISLVYIIDDIFDVYGGLDELTLFTDAVNKWEITTLPDYMQTCFKALNGITNEIANRVYQKHGWNPIDSLKKAWAKLCNAFLLEAEWFASKKLPNEEEYLKNAIISSGVHVVLVHMFFLLGQGITKETVNLMDQVPGLVSSTAAILRLWDDLGNAKDENQDGHDGSYIECYMNAHQGCLVEVARDHVHNMIKNEWKRLNQEYLSSKAFPACFKRACLDAARMVPAMYDYDDDHRLPSLEDYISSLLSESSIAFV